MTDSEYRPQVGDKAIAVIGPDYAPNQKLEVEVISKASLDSWVCLDTRDGRLLTVRTRKLSRASENNIRPGNDLGARIET